MKTVLGLFMWVCELSRKMRNHTIGRKLYDFLDEIGARIIITRLYNWRLVHYNEKHPNEQMLRSREFFKKNGKRVQRVIELLEDEESRNVMKRMIRFRCFSIYKDLPDNSLKTQYFINDFFDFKDGEVFIDCGAYTGDTITSFKRQMKRLCAGGGGGKKNCF